MWTEATLEEVHIIIPSVCVLQCVALPSDSPPCSWLRPAGAATPPRRWSEVEPAPGPRRLEETRTRLQREQVRIFRETGECISSSKKDKEHKEDGADLNIFSPTLQY